MVRSKKLVAQTFAKRSTAGSWSGRHRFQAKWSLLLLVATWGCSVADEGTLPADVEDPSSLKTPNGAVARYREVLSSFPTSVDGAMTVGGVLTDELTALPLPYQTGAAYTEIDSRNILLRSGDGTFESIGDKLYARLHRLRGQAREARGFVRAYAPDSSLALAAHLFAVEGYAELFLADLFCSGIPLSTVDFDADFTLASGSTTTEVYRHAAELFDSALALASDSARIQTLASIALARASLTLGEYAKAASAVAGIPDNFVYHAPVTFAALGGTAVSDTAALYWYATRSSVADRLGALTMGDTEGIYGIPYRSSEDPRTRAWTNVRPDVEGNLLYFPIKYTAGNSLTGNPASPVNIVLASGLEARLIESEAALQRQDGTSEWLDRLNAIRTNGTFTTQPNPSDPTQTDTLWLAGTGGVAGLRPLDDPGSEDLRVDLLFRERAFWLYLTAQRQGDLRRLVRNYLRDPAILWPTGFYEGGAGEYGESVVLRVPERERILNPRYTGCIHLGA